MVNVVSSLLAVSPKDIGIPAVVLYELEYGIARSTAPRRRMKQLEEICVLWSRCSRLGLKGKKLRQVDVQRWKKRNADRAI